MTQENTDRRLRVALLGSGLFATRSHAPALKRHENVFDCIAVWSQRLESAEALVSNAFSDNNKNGGAKEGDKAESQDTNKCLAYAGQDGLKNLLARNDLDAVIIALPISVQPSFVLRALEAGKYVLSEKPIAPTVQEGRQLIKTYKNSSTFSHIPWSVAENYRYEPAILAAAKAVESFDSPCLVTLTLRLPFPPDNAYVKTSWRKNPSWYGGYFVDCFVHAAALLRLVLGNDVQQVSAQTLSRANHLPGVDTMIIPAYNSTTSSTL